MRTTSLFGFVMLSLMIVGCGGNGSAATEEAGPLTLERWRTLPPEVKYDEATFEELRARDPKLQTSAGWDEFMRTTVIPERERDIPVKPGERSMPR